MSLILLVLAGGPSVAGAQSSRFFVSGDGEIAMTHAHFNERLHVRYRDAAGAYDAAALARINRFFRSRDDGEVGEVSLRLIELIDYVQDHYRPTKTMLLSGYRTPAFNQRLRDSGAKAADSSMHVEGLAADIHFGGVDLKKMWVELRERKIAGLGYYKAQSFMHIDTGRPRFWEPQTSRVGERIAAGNARVLARTEFDRYRDLHGAQLRLHSVTAFPLRIATVARAGTTTLRLEPGDETVSVEDGCLVFRTPAAAYPARVIEVDGLPALKQRGPIVLSTCPPRLEATPDKIESNPVEITP